MAIRKKLILGFLSVALLVGIVGYVGVNISNNTRTIKKRVLISETLECKYQGEISLFGE